MDAKMDDTIAHVLAMGFDIEDCQQAIDAGKTTPEAIIEWILAGKPKEKPVLRLRPLAQSAACPDEGETQSHPHAASSDSPTEEEGGPVSRYFKTEEQRRDKKRFEEKVREQTEKEVKAERLQQKMERARVLKQIHEDREQIRERKRLSSPPQSSSPIAAASLASASMSTTSPRELQCVLKIRLPTGETLRQTFQSTDTLVTVYGYVTEKMKTTYENSEFVQPFPQHTFTRSDWSQTLAELLLTPTSTLVLKKSSPSAAQPHDDQLGAQQQADNNAADSDEDEMNDFEPPGAARLNNPANNPFGGFGPLGIAPPGQRGGPQPIGGNAVHPGYIMVPGDYAFGQHQNQSVAELAAQAAEQRFAHAEPSAPTPSSHSAASLHFRPPSLLRLAMDHLARRLSEQATPYIHSLGGITVDLALKFIEFLKHECQLKPRTLNCFLACYLNRLNLDCYPYCTNELLHAVRLHTNLVHLNLFSCPLITDLGFKQLSTLKRLKVLNIGGCRQLTDQIFETISEMPNMQSLNLEDTGVTDVGVQEYIHHQPQNLTSLNLNRTNVTEQTIIALEEVHGLKILCLEDTKVQSLSGVQNLVNLECLNVAHTGIVTDSLLCLQGHPNLLSLNIAGTERVSGNLALSYIKGLRLQQLTLPSRHSVDDRGMVHLPSLALTVLDLTNFSNITDQGILPLGQITSLRKLLLCNTRISDAGMLHLKDLVNLVELYLDRTIVSDSGVSIIRNFTKLEELSLSSTGITSRLLLSGAFTNLQSLKKLNLSRTNICDKGIVCLKLFSLTLLNLDCTRVHPQVEQTIYQNCPALEKVTLANLSAVIEEEDGEENEDEDA